MARNGSQNFKKERSFMIWWMCLELSPLLRQAGSDMRVLRKGITVNAAADQYEQMFSRSCDDSCHALLGNNIGSEHE